MLRRSIRWTSLVVWQLLWQSAWTADAVPMQWQPWSHELFAHAAHDRKFVLVQVSSPWCNQCRQLERTTYTDPMVRELLDKKYLAVHVDRYERPDIDNRYPGFDEALLVILDADGTEILQRSGFIPPEFMVSILQAVIDDPSPAPSASRENEVDYSRTATFDAQLLTTLRNETPTSYDQPDEFSSFASTLIDAELIEYQTQLATSDPRQRESIEAKLRLAQKLLDPVWGGSFQSLIVPVTGSGGTSRFVRVQVGKGLDDSRRAWNEPHFEKPLFVQAQSLQLYSRAYGQLRKAEYLESARQVHAYVREFLTSADGAFYLGQTGETGQEGAKYFAAADNVRRTLGIPPIDKRIYTRENGWMIDALCALYAVSRDPALMSQAKRAAQWIIAHRGIAGGGFSRDAKDAGGPFLGDTLAMGQAFLALYAATGERDWLIRADAAARFISANFAIDRSAGFAATKVGMDPKYGPHAARRENIQLARFAIQLARLNDSSLAREMTERTVRYLATEEIAEAGLPAGILLVADAFKRE